MRGIETRIKKLEDKSGTGKNNFPEVESWINQGLFYDELTEDQRTIYCNYSGTDRETMERVRKALFDNPLHFQLEERQEPLTGAELSKRIDEIENILWGGK